MDKTQNRLFERNTNVAAQQRSNIRSQNPLFRTSSNIGAMSSAVIVCEVVNPVSYGVNILPTNSVMVRMLEGPNFDAISAFVFVAMNPSDSTFTIGSKVFVLMGELQTPIVIQGVGGSGGGSTVLLPLHAHTNMYSGGIAANGMCHGGA